jgi:hypothetical protein
LDRRRTILAALLLLAAGFGAGMVFRRPIARRLQALLPVTTEQVRLDAVSLLSVLAPDPRLPAVLPKDAPEWGPFWEQWDARRARYSPEQLADLRARLEGFLDFLQAEYADAAEIYRTGRRPEDASDAARELRLRVRQDFGETGEALLRQADELREEAYKASPRVAGVDPDLPDYGEKFDDLLRRWLPLAQARVAELTAPAPR